MQAGKVRRKPQCNMDQLGLFLKVNLSIQTLFVVIGLGSGGIFSAIFSRGFFWLLVFALAGEISAEAQNLCCGFVVSALHCHQCLVTEDVWKPKFANLIPVKCFSKCFPYPHIPKSQLVEISSDSSEVPQGKATLWRFEHKGDQKMFQAS